MRTIPYLTALALVFAGGCSDVEGDDHDHDHDHEHEVITTVELSLTAASDGTSLVFTWADVDDSANPVIDDMLLTDGETYDVSVTFWNELEDPAEDITPEIGDEADEHQIFFTGSAVQGPATGDNAAAILEHAYADADAGGLPLGLDNTLTTLGAGSGELILTLRHLPPENDEAVKVEGLAEDVAASGFGAIGGANDAQVTFPVDVQ